ncbi:uncharacterized protein LOC122712685 isoform X2 [Apis laboriosa]|nr:uncharacterized protein LOC122712685 isoform X2 [Apis laboriosa]
MSEAEDIQSVVENHDFQSIIEGESRKSNSVHYLNTYENIPKETVKEYPEETKEELYQEKKEKEIFVENERKSNEAEKKEGTQAAGSSTGTVDDNDKGVSRLEENATRKEEATNTSTTTGTTIDGRNAPVGEWNSLPHLVDRLRAALELSLGSRRDDEPPAVLEDSGIDSEEDFRMRNSMEQALGNCKEPELKKDLKFLEDLLLSDIQTALSRLRETLEKIDVAALAKHGAASDPTSKLQLLRLVSSLLSRLQVPEEKTKEKISSVLPSTSSSRRRRGTRHTIGVSTEELAKARKWLEEEKNILPLKDITLVTKEQKDPNVSGNGDNVINIIDKKPEEIRDKCTKDAINQRQLLEDKNKEIRDNCVFRGIQQMDIADSKNNRDLNMYQTQYRVNNYQEKENNENNIVEDSEERSRVSKLASILKQRAELSASGSGKYGGANKFSAKKSKIKRANTIDIPSYLKLQAESLGHETAGCVSLRKPINVGDKTTFNSVNVIVPTFQPKTENDRKFLALINKNNEVPSVSSVVPFKTIGQTMDMSSLTNENWNSRFSNIKTAFDKSSAIDEREIKPSLKFRANKMFPSSPQTQIYSNTNPNYDPRMTKMDTTTGFRHAPSSPFRKIEKSGSPSNVPLSYHWPKNVPMPTSTLKEKARMMFDRETTQPSSKPSRNYPEKSSFVRSPWIEHEKNESKSNGTVTENGKLDYRSFCKQFAPFVGKTFSMESKKLEEQHQQELIQRDRLPGIVDGKISFKVVPDKRVQTYQYPSMERRVSKEKLEIIKSGKEHKYDEDSFADAILRDSSSVAVQTGIDENYQNEERSFRVAPRISKNQNLICNNVAVQTSSELNKPVISVNDIDSGKQWTSLCYEQSDSDQTSEDRQRFILDHNQNYHTVSNDSEFNSSVMIPDHVINEQDFKEIVPFLGTQNYQKSIENPVKNYQTENTDNQDYSSSLISPILSNLSDYNQSDEVLNAREECKNHQKTSDWPVESSDFPNDQNIQNQDISPEIGVVTRYTCAIGTVASSVDSPEPRSEEIAVDSRTSSSPSPSQWSWTRSRPPTNETIASEDEIRRHNLLQQSLVRRLQNEITSLNDQPQISNFGQHLTINQKSQSPNLVQSYQQKFSDQSMNFTTTHQQQNHNQPINVSQKNIPLQQSNFNKSIHTIHQEQTFNQSVNFDRSSGSQKSNRFIKYLTPVSQKKPETSRVHSPSPMIANRVGALREAYEQTPNSQTKSIHKERSPVPNGMAPNDSSDEYLVSCATKPSRSIVLSKSESWHQLAISNRYPRTSRVNAPASLSSFPKPPKPRSPSSQKLRSKQFEASSMADSVKKMEDKIRQYFDQPSDIVETKDSMKHRRSPRFASKGMLELSRSRTMPGLSEEKLHVLIPTPQQMPLLNVNTADVDKVFDDLFEEATRTDNQ